MTTTPSPTFKPLLILGNAKSLANHDFYNYKMDTMGMNIAFRYWHQIGWYPTYYISLDNRVNFYYSRDIYHLIQNRKLFGIKGFLLRKSILRVYPQLAAIPEVKFIEPLNRRNNYGFTGDTNITSGSFSIRWGLNLGYTKIYLLGIDCFYHPINNPKRLINKSNRLRQTIINNKNYFYDGYQRRGDPLHISYKNPPKRNANHLEGFKAINREFNPYRTGRPYKVVNANPRSRLKAKRVLPFQLIPEYLHKTASSDPDTYINPTQPPTDPKSITSRIINFQPPPPNSITTDPTFISRQSTQPPRPKNKPKPKPKNKPNKAKNKPKAKPKNKPKANKPKNKPKPKPKFGRHQKPKKLSKSNLTKSKKKK